MADVSDVEAALVSFVTAALYPEGPTAASVTGQPLRVYRGWPLSGSLEADLLRGVANVSVFAVPAASRNTTRWAAVTSTTTSVPTLTVQVSGNSASFGGQGGATQVAGLLVSNQPFVYRGQAGDTPALVAAVLAQSVRAVRACWLSGATVSVPGVPNIVARVVADGAAMTEWARQEQGFRISAWCPNPSSRDLVCRTLSEALATVRFLGLPDGTGGFVRYRSTSSFDERQDAQSYRRDLVYDVEYATTDVRSAPSMLFGDLQMSSAELFA